MNHAFVIYLENKRRKAQRQGKEKTRDVAQRSQKNKAID